MWCSQCRQDVPGIASVESSSSICCARCGADISSSSNAPSTSNIGISESSNQAADSLNFATFPGVDNWQLENDLEDAKALASSVLVDRSGYSRENPSEEKNIRHNNMELDIPKWHVHREHLSTKTKSVTKEFKSSRRRRMFFAWPILFMSISVLVCGGVLLVWSLVTERAELWKMGLPLSLVGQAGFVLGLILQMDGLWQSSKDTNNSLEILDNKINDLNKKTKLMSNTHSLASRSFYKHLAEGAGPQMLLADLKGQLDHLAEQIVNEDY